jgi:predicted nuclease of restriction endonuclease-like (RecB) superfamily
MPSELTAHFTEIVSIIEKAKAKIYKSVNKGFIDMYWDVGEYISRKDLENGWGKSTIQEFSQFVQSKYPDITGFSPQNVWRMKQFYELYKDRPKLSPLVREITWSNNLLIMAGAKTDESMEFYIKLCIKNNYSKRELDRQIDSMLFERTMISNKKNKSLIEKSKGLAVLRDNYTLEFINLPEKHHEKDLQHSILANLKKFILEFGKDFSLIGEEYRIQVGNQDFYIDLLFYNRELTCLVAIELKVGKFSPEHLGQLNFYLEALDRDVKKPHENPSVGLILCASKDDTVVEYALSRSLTPALISEYTLKLPDKKLLRKKLVELTEYSESEETP